MDICSDGKIIDHAAYYDHASVVKQMKPAKGESGAPAVGRLSPSDSGLQPKVEAEREAQAQLAQLYAGKVLSMLDNCCHVISNLLHVVGSRLASTLPEPLQSPGDGPEKVELPHKLSDASLRWAHQPRTCEVLLLDWHIPADVATR